ncbi:MAG: nucleotidyltransferase family protein [Chloroflexi bacterium]|nr:nucleotidyltransferase family protein [Chloroflexota bacterium]
MGQPKALLPWGKVTLIEYQFRQLSEAGVDEIVVVLGHATDEIRERVPDTARVVVNLHFQEGRATSLRAGALALSDDADPIVVLNVDQPRPGDLISRLIKAAVTNGALINRPVFGKEHGHPIVLAGSLLDELRRVEEESQGLLGVVNAHRDEMQDIDLGDERVLVDFNTREEYEKALARFGQS